MRKRLLINMGLLTIALFVFLRLINVYGDPAPWSRQENIVLTLMSFLNTSKYPVSLEFTLMTVGPALVLLAWFEHIRGNVAKVLEIFGRVPLFYFVLHFYLIHAAALIVYMFKAGKSFSDIDLHFSKSFGGITPEGGHSLPWVYLAWAGVVLIMYPLCKWYNRYKSTHKHWWLSYL